MRNRPVQPPAQPCLAVLLVRSSAGLVLQRASSSLIELDHLLLHSYSITSSPSPQEAPTKHRRRLQAIGAEYFTGGARRHWWIIPISSNVPTKLFVFFKLKVWDLLQPRTGLT